MNEIWLWASRRLVDIAFQLACPVTLLLILLIIAIFHGGKSKTFDKS